MSAEFPAMLTRNLREHVDAICAGRDPRRRAKLFLKKYGNLLDDLCALPELQRLKKLRQYGVKMYAGQSSLVAFDGQMISVSRQRLIHTRYQHSLLVCAHMIALGSHLQIDYDELAIAACGALLHDIGHTPFFA